MIVSKSDTAVPKGWKKHMLTHTALGPCTEHMCYGMVHQVSSENRHTHIYIYIFNRPGVAGAVLHTASSLSHSAILFLQIFIIS